MLGRTGDGNLRHQIAIGSRLRQALKHNGGSTVSRRQVFANGGDETELIFLIRAHVLRRRRAVRVRPAPTALPHQIPRIGVPLGIGDLRVAQAKGVSHLVRQRRAILKQIRPEEGHAVAARFAIQIETDLAAPGAAGEAAAEGQVDPDVVREIDVDVGCGRTIRSQAEKISIPGGIGVR